MLGQGYDAYIHCGKVWLSTAVKGFWSQVSSSQQKVFQQPSNPEVVQRNQREHIAAPKVCSILFGYIRHVVKQHNGAVYVIYCPLHRPRLETPKQMLTNVVSARWSYCRKPRWCDEGEILEHWHLSSTKQVCITTDSGANVVKAVCDLDWPWMSCFGHNLHLAITNAMKDDNRISRAIGVCEGIMTAFSQSWKRRRELSKAQLELKLPSCL
jgi:hypothetical protein